NVAPDSLFLTRFFTRAGIRFARKRSAGRDDERALLAPARRCCGGNRTAARRLAVARHSRRRDRAAATPTRRDAPRPTRRREEVHADAAVRIELVNALARAAGIGGMAGGQMLDLEGEGRFGKHGPVDVALLQRMKTGALLRFACIAGAILGKASKAQQNALD